MQQPRTSNVPSSAQLMRIESAPVLSRPRTLSEAPSDTPSSLVGVLELAGLVDSTAIATAFEAEGVDGIELAGSLTLEEVKTVLVNHGLVATVGRVRLCHNALVDAATQKQASDGSHELEPSPSTVLMRSMLRQDNVHVKDTLAMRLTQESVFAALMLTIAFQAILEPPELDTCEERFNSTSCLGIRRAYAASWGLCAGFFLCSCLISLASVRWRDSNRGSCQTPTFDLLTGLAVADANLPCGGLQRALRSGGS